jgi:hypothetical protein
VIRGGARKALNLWRYYTSDEFSAELGCFYSDLIPFYDEWGALCYMRGGGWVPRLHKTPPIEPGAAK